MAIGDRVFVDPIRSWGCWIDDSGDAQPFRVHDNDTDALAAPVLPLSDLGPDPFPGRSMSTLAFREFGMVRLERRAGALKIKFDLETVTMPSIGGARALMRAAFHSGPIDLIFRYGGWARERFYDVDKALSRVMQLCAHRGVEPETMIACDDHTLEDARTQAHPMIRRAINAWNRTDRRAIESFDSEFRKLTPYILTLSENNSIGNLSYRHVGGRSHIVSYLGREWARNVIGTLSNHGHCDTEFETAISEPRFRNPILTRWTGSNPDTVMSAACSFWLNGTLNGSAISVSSCRTTPSAESARWRSWLRLIRMSAFPSWGSAAPANTHPRPPATALPPVRIVPLWAAGHQSCANRLCPSRV